MNPRTYKSEGVVLKRRDFGEADRVVTIFTKHHGKVVALAKGVRKISSRRAGSLEPATQAVLFFARGKTFDLITQVGLINSFSSARQSLKRLTQVNLILEIVDLLTVENQSHPDVYQVLVGTLTTLARPGLKRKELVTSIKQVVKLLGFGEPEDGSEQALKEFIETITDKELRSKKMLSGL